MTTRFSAGQLNKFEEILTKKLNSLSNMEREHETEALHRPGELPSDRIMPADWSSETSTMGVNLKLADQELREVQEIENALTRISLGEFGFCEDCDAAIPLKRLEVQPEARLCVRCETELESANARLGYATPDFELEDPTL